MVHIYISNLFLVTLYTTENVNYTVELHVLFFDLTFSVIPYE